MSACATTGIEPIIFFNSIDEGAPLLNILCIYFNVNLQVIFCKLSSGLFWDLH